MSGVHEAMAKVMAEVSSIAKVRSENVSYMFRSIDDVLNALHGPLSDNGLFMAPRILDDWQLNPIPGTNNRTQYQAVFRVAVDVYAADGSMVTLGPGLAQSHDYGDKAVYQAQQNAIKYLLLEAFAIPTAEQDMDARHPDEVPSGTEAERAFRWVGEESAVFKDWTKKERTEAYGLAMKMLAFDGLSTMAQAEAIFEHMRNQYENRYDK